MLKLPVGSELHPAHDPHHGRRIGLQALRCGSNTAENELSRVFQRRPDNLLPFWTK
jgi:hypothetical protein